jgi:hypothetical protein
MKLFGRKKKESETVRLILRRLKDLGTSEGDEHLRTISKDWEFQLMKLPDTPEVREAFAKGFHACLTTVRTALLRGDY